MNAEEIAQKIFEKDATLQPNAVKVKAEEHSTEDEIVKQVIKKYSALQANVRKINDSANRNWPESKGY